MQKRSIAVIILKILRIEKRGYFEAYQIFSSLPKNSMSMSMVNSLHSAYLILGYIRSFLLDVKKWFYLMTKCHFSERLCKQNIISGVSSFLLLMIIQIQMFCNYDQIFHNQEYVLICPIISGKVKRLQVTASLHSLKKFYKRKMLYAFIPL